MVDTRGMGTSEQRREARYPARIVARVVRRGQSIELLTNDVSFRGVFLRTDSPPALRQLMKVELLLPSGPVVSGHAMVVHVTNRPEGQPKGEGAVPGAGVQFWGPITHAREWEQFVHQLKVRERAGMAAAKTTDKVRRASERFKLSLEVVLDGKTSMTRDVSENGMAIRTDLPLPVGTRARIEMRAGDQWMHFDVVVRRAIDESGFRGLGVELADLDPAKRAALVAFVRRSAPSDDESIFIEIDDPELH
ncbi:MAG: PilZ domain-containing protein [Labilithrix sp.]|nr:PilZ domain-containing protein [Labilithrix sp.]